MVYLAIRDFLNEYKPVGIVDDNNQKVEAFIALFNGDVSAAHAALEAYKKNPTTPVLKNLTQHADDAIISLENISKRYTLGKQTIHALQNVSLSIYKGEFIAITGASGSGKSTLLQLIGCLDKPTSGQVIIEGKVTTKMGDNALSELRQKAIGFIFQSFFLQPFLRLSDNLAVPAMFTHKKKETIATEVDTLLQRVGLSERAKHFPKELSGGQVQRAAIARALINNPRIILADEPTGNLDSANSASIINLFRTIRDTLNTTIIVVTHNPEIARQADRVIELKDGAIV